MIYTSLTKKALLISFNAHKEQIDKSGMPYVYHPFHLAKQMDDECGCKNQYNVYKSRQIHER